MYAVTARDAEKAFLLGILILEPVFMEGENGFASQIEGLLLSI
jgi:hypothetical protein